MSASRNQPAPKDLLRFLTCGSVDDGKSTLIGRLLHDTRSVFDDQMAALQEDSEIFGTTGPGNPDFALLVDGLAAERQQGITIDVAYRYFSTGRRSFIVADTPGHEQYTRNMITGASTADAAVLLVDARAGLTTQTRRHFVLCHMMGVTAIALAVNKMDLIAWDRARFTEIQTEASAFAATLGRPAPTAFPVCARSGENLTTPIRSAEARWYQGATLLAWLETVDAAAADDTAPLRFPVQLVLRPDDALRGAAGRIEAGSVRPGDTVRVFPSGREATIARIVTADGDRQQARAGDSVTLTLDRDIDIARGDVIAAADRPPLTSDQIAARLVWMSDQPLLPERRYLLRLGTATANARITRLKYRLDVDTLSERPARTLDLNDIGQATLSLDRPLVLEPYACNRTLGGFILIDKTTNDTVGCGLVAYSLRRADTIRWQPLRIDAAARETLNGHKSAVLWFTGLSGAGKSTLADGVEQRLHGLGIHSMLLDGDNVRHGLNRDLGFTDADRVENIRRFAEVARLMTEAGLVVLVSVISPFAAERAQARALFPEGRFLEIFVDAPLEICEQRDPKGLYRQARAGAIKNFTGLDSPYETPKTPDLHVRTDRTDIDTLVDRVVDLLRQGSVI